VFKKNRRNYFAVFYFARTILEIQMSIDRIIELETKLSYQEDTITQLNDVVCRQQNQIDEINKKCELLFSSTRALTEKLSVEPGEVDKPPHY
jgi:SlyX protein